MSTHLDHLSDELAGRGHQDPAHQVRMFQRRAMELLEAIEGRREPIEALERATDELTHVVHEHLPGLHELLEKSHAREGEGARHPAEEVELRELDEQVARLRQAAELLAQAGRVEMAEQTHRQAEELEGHLRARLQERERPHEPVPHEGFPPQVMERMEHLQHQLNELREQLGDLQESLRRR
jgi:conjugal transfer/entry exclusion protein